MISRQHRASADLIAREKELPLLRAEYDRLVEFGAFQNERVELLFGKLVAMSPLGADHFYAITRLNKLLIAALGSRAEVYVQGPIALSDDSEPEPDIAVGPPARPKQLATSAHFVIEVADSSVRDDRVVKGLLYAANGIPEYWLVNLPEQIVEVYSAIAGGRYQEMVRVGRGGVLVPQAFPDVAIRVDDFLP